MEENGSADRVSDDNYTIIHYASEKPSCSVRGSSRVQWGISSVSAYAASEGEQDTQEPDSG